MSVKQHEAVESCLDKKLVDLARDTTDIHAATPFTTDHGTKVSNTDNWLRIVDPSQTGPALLEDQIAREKVC
jgi:catalase